MTGAIFAAFVLVRLHTRLHVVVMFTTLISPAQAESIIGENIAATSDEMIALEHSWGRVLRAPVVADRDFPPFHRATMDGYLSREPLRVGQTYEVRGALLAGHSMMPLSSQCPVEVATGASLSDADVHLAPYEWTNIKADGRIEVLQPTMAGQFIHAQGSDATRGDVLLTAGQLMGAGEIAIAASAGASHLCVAAKARIALLTTGNEVVPHETVPEPWQIRGSHAPMLRAILHAGFYQNITSRHVGDDLQESINALVELRGLADVILITGGISAGARDFVREAACSLWGAPLYHGIAQKPGKPMAFWNGPPAVFALPGNPLSVLATFSRYVIPALCRMEGRECRTQFLTISSTQAAHEHLALLLPVKASNGACQIFSNSGNLIAARGVCGVVEIPPRNAMMPPSPARAFYPYQFPSP